MLFSEPKIPQYYQIAIRHVSNPTFSALQRAENSSIRCRAIPVPRPQGFQCSSASRKFLNVDPADGLSPKQPVFQCSSASRKFLNPLISAIAPVAVRLSVLFSEPKIPQSDAPRSDSPSALLFQCSSASRKFLNSGLPEPTLVVHTFQCSSASRKFLN